MPDEYVIKYKVGGNPYQAGPYPASSVEYHRDDIAAFEGITDVEVVPVEPKTATERLMESDLLEP